MRFDNLISTEMDASLSLIRGLQNYINSGTLSELEIAHHKEMISKKKKTLIYKLHFKDKKRKEL